jgi:hypothetical protein
MSFMPLAISFANADVKIDGDLLGLAEKGTTKTTRELAVGS